MSAPGPSSPAKPPPLAGRASPSRRRTLFVVWATYGSFYLCRVNIGPARLDLQRDLAIDAVEMGFILGALKIGYALGQLVNGQLAERLGPKRILLFGAVGSVVACSLFVIAPTLAAAPLLSHALPTLSRGLGALAGLFAKGAVIGPLAALLWLLWLANGYFQACGWPPCVKVISNWFTARERGRVMGVVGTSYQLGSVVTLVAAGALVDALGWRFAFLVPAGALLVSTVHASLFLRERPPSAESGPLGTSARPRLWTTLRETLTNGRIAILALGLFGLDIVRYGFLDWAPGHLKEVQASGTAIAALKIAVFPLAGALGALTSGWITDRFLQSRRAPVISVMLGAVGVLTLAYRELVGFGVVPAVVCLALIGFFLYGAQILLVGTAAQDFARGGATAAAAGFVDFTGYLGAFAGDVATGFLLKGHGWHAALLFWAMSAIVASAVVATLWRARPLGEDARCSA